MSRIQNCHWESNLTKFSWRKQEKYLVANLGKSLDLYVAWKNISVKCLVLDYQNMHYYDSGEVSGNANVTNVLFQVSSLTFATN